MSHSRIKTLGVWKSDGAGGSLLSETPGEALARLDATVFAICRPDGIAFAINGYAHPDTPNNPDDNAIAAIAPPCLPQDLGDRDFCVDNGLRYPLYAGSMAHGIASEELVEAMGRAGMLGFFGSAGLPITALRDSVRRIKSALAGLPWGFNLINSPNDPDWERAAADVFIEMGVHLIEASAYVLPTPSLVKYRVTGLTQDHNGGIIEANHIIAKVSRVEVARRFMAPPSPKLLQKLAAAGDITEEEACLAAHIPLARDITVEADSGGHTDHRSALAVMPSMLLLRDAIQREYGYLKPLRIGLAGGIGTPAAAAAAFAMGAAYVVTGSINQACVESGAAPIVREMLAQATQTDVADAPAADMFEMGVTVQVLKKGTRFAERAAKLYALYRAYDSIDEMPDGEQRKLEDTVFRMSIEEVWRQVEGFFEARSPKQIEKALHNPKHKMALLFRWYLGNAAHWARQGIADRKDDFQIWCGPAMGAFNDWTRGSFLEDPDNRSAAAISLNLLYGAAVLLRIQSLRAQGTPIASNSEWTAPQRVLPDFMVQTEEAVQQ